jgi:hypothetical protein
MNKRQILGYVMVIAGFLVLLVNALAYIFNWELKHPALTVFGLISVAVGTQTARRPGTDARKNIFLIAFTLIVVVILAAYLYSAKNNTNPQTPTASLTEAQAQVIAENTCIKGGEALTSGGTYNENSKTWWFDANLNATRPGCNPACVVSEETLTVEINWRCTGLVPPAESTSDALKKLFAQKYPKYAKTVTVRVDKETVGHARGGVSFETGEAGGIFLAVKTGGQWQIVHDGNGQIPCTLSTYGFPADMLSDCAK